MAQSKIHICNTALNLLGADSIRDFDENNKRSRLCDVFFESTKVFLLTKFDWPFARGYARLIEVDTLGELPPGYTAFQLPADCKNPRELHPPGSREAWRIVGLTLWCKSSLGPDIYLHYTADVSDPRLFSDTFSNLLSIGLAVKIGPSITQDKKLISELYRQYKLDQQDAWENDANIGNSYREPDEDPDNDTFVNPDGIVDFAGNERY